MAARLITELKDKIVTVPTGDVTLSDISGEQTVPVPAAAPADDTAEDVISALINLGYQRLEAYKVVSKIYADNADKPVSELIRLALKEFARKDF